MIAYNNAAVGTQLHNSPSHQPHPITSPAKLLLMVRWTYPLCLSPTLQLQRIMSSSSPSPRWISLHRQQIDIVPDAVRRFSLLFPEVGVWQLALSPSETPDLNDYYLHEQVFQRVWTGRMRSKPWHSSEAVAEVWYPSNAERSLYYPKVPHSAWDGCSLLPYRSQVTLLHMIYVFEYKAKDVHALLLSNIEVNGFDQWWYQLTHPTVPKQLHSCQHSTGALSRVLRWVDRVDTTCSLQAWYTSKHAAAVALPMLATTQHTELVAVLIPRRKRQRLN
jgi:hypothetical protein